MVMFFFFCFNFFYLHFFLGIVSCYLYCTSFFQLCSPSYRLFPVFVSTNHTVSFSESRTLPLFLNMSPFTNRKINQFLFEKELSEGEKDDRVSIPSLLDLWIHHVLSNQVTGCSAAGQKGNFRKCYPFIVLNHSSELM